MDIPATNVFRPLLLEVFADLLAHAPLDLHQAFFLPLFVRFRKETVAVVWVHVPKHGAAQVGDAESLEKAVPPAHPAVVVGIQHRHAVLGSSGLCRAGHASAPGILERHLLPVPFHPVEAPVFFVGEDGGWVLFSQARRHGKAAGASANYDDVVDKRHIWRWANMRCGRSAAG
jgi:hypothetical protein